MKTSTTPAQLLFLPGALGRTELWRPLADLLRHPASRQHIGWPGFAGVPADPQIKSIDDLVAMVATRIERPTALIAQSMGGVIAMRLALEKPESITHLVLAVTSGGLDVAALGGSDWRASLQAAHPQLPDWFVHDRQDLAAQLHEVRIPTLLLWGDRDPISPVRVGERLASLLPDARLHIVEGGDHDLAESHAPELAPLIDGFLAGAVARKEAPET
ncbi:Pimeloyl-ACP methyl ester carboxylesterase [Solimonas aquatica]|uniref:Pimeloyl-ACP methyl ester carboxylesterase n=1 Tax=Solimonas aquatica TaxID=489703 RepID=A0A1H9KCU2_9GAMM|nr:alpha/beta fold hydrolase [Solimonas aquatica]SEQ96970.1 Pimeloyl-ACP methyl ester carboxylesterase [Solimonas aquatica]